MRCLISRARRRTAIAQIEPGSVTAISASRALEELTLSLSPRLQNSETAGAWRLRPTLRVESVMTARVCGPRFLFDFAYSFSGQQRMAKRQKRVRRSARSVTDIDRQVAINIRQLRLERGLSQEKLAAAIGTSFQQLQKYETGKNRITIGRLASICEVLGVSLTDVLKNG